MAEYMKAQALAEANPPSVVRSNDNGQFVTDTLTIAGLVENQHKNVLELVRNYLNDFQEFGSLAFETRVIREDGRGGQPTEYAILNEDQAYLLLTYMRNTAIVRNAKKALVRAFKVAREGVSIHSNHLIRIEKALAESAELYLQFSKGFLETQSELRNAVKEVDCKVEKVDGKVDKVDEKVDSLGAQVIDLAKIIAKRKEFTAATKKEYLITVAQRYQGKCPCCQVNTILDSNGQLISGKGVYEHWNGKQSNRATDGWATCVPCNIELETNRHNKRTAFERFQQLREEVCEPQTQLTLFEKKCNV